MLVLDYCRTEGQFSHLSRTMLDQLYTALLHQSSNQELVFTHHFLIDILYSNNLTSSAGK